MKLLEKLTKALPPVFGRPAVTALFPGIITSKTLANLDSSGDGPPRYQTGGRVFYEREEFLTWLGKRIREVA